MAGARLRVTSIPVSSIPDPLLIPLDAYYRLEDALEVGAAERRAVSEVAALRFPEELSYGVAAGVQKAADICQQLSFSAATLQNLENFLQPDTLEYLAKYKFDGTLAGYEEGSLFFPHSPLFTMAGSLADTILLMHIALPAVHHASNIATAFSAQYAGAGDVSVTTGANMLPHSISDSVRATFIAGAAYTDVLQAATHHGIETPPLDEEVQRVSIDEMYASHSSVPFQWRLVEVEEVDGEVTSMNGGRKTAYRRFDDEWQVAEEHLITESVALLSPDLELMQRSYFANGRAIPADELNMVRERSMERVRGGVSPDLEVTLNDERLWKRA